MAIWQFTVRFLPDTKVKKHFGYPPLFVSFDDYYKDSENLCIVSPLHSELEIYLDNALKLCCGFERIKSWHSSLTIWGEDNSNEVKLSLDELSNSYELSAEIDLRNFRSEFIDSIVAIAKKLDCILYTKNHTIIYPSKDELIEEIKKSKAYSFCLDPYGYLAQQIHNPDV